MSSETDIAGQHLLAELAELSLEVARDLQGAMKTADYRDMVRLANAFASVGRCLRMSIALAARLARGEALAPAQRDRGLEADLDEEDFDDEDFDDEERPEGLERESLFDRLPAGDLDTQVATIARTLASAARALPAAGAYRARCEALIAGVRRDLPRRLAPAPDPRRGPLPAGPAGFDIAAAPNRSRGPPRSLG